MCGIAGIVGRSEPEEIRRMTTAVAYRGPDDFGHLWADTKTGQVFKEGQSSPSAPSEKTNLALGHRRLSILDLSSDGHQPMANEAATLWITYNGEVYNYLEIREELTRLGCSFRSKTDTEVILKAYETWGTDCFSRFNGMWALAIWDVRAGKLVLSRDRFGVKPFYYLAQPGRFAFASEMKQIFSLNGLKPEINLPVVQKFLTDGISDHSEEVFFQGIRKLKPGHFMTVTLPSPGASPSEMIRFETQRFWELEVSEEKKSSKTQIEYFYWLFRDAVRLRLRSDVEVGGLLSGGLDSSSIAGMVAQIAGESKIPLENFTFIASCSRYRKYDEQRFMDEVQRHSGIRLVKVFPEAKLAMGMLSQVMHHQEEPFGDFSVVAQHLVYKAAHEKGLKVLLSGQGGDETLCGYKKYYIYHLLNLLHEKRLPTFLKESLCYLINNNVAGLRLSEAKRYFSTRWRDRIDPLQSLLNPDTFPQLNVREVPRSRSIGERQKADIELYSVPVLLRYEDRNSMAFSSEVRLPFLDYRLVQHTINLSDDLKMRNGWSKYILRKSLAQILPKKIRRRRDKMGFDTPGEKWMREDLREEMLDMFSSSHIAKHGLIKREALQKLYQAYLRGQSNVWHADISRILMLEIWLRTFFGGPIDKSREPSI